MLIIVNFSKEIEIINSRTSTKFAFYPTVSYILSITVLRAIDCVVLKLALSPTEK